MTAVSPRFESTATRPDENVHEERSSSIIWDHNGVNPAKVAVTEAVQLTLNDIPEDSPPPEAG